MISNKDYHTLRKVVNEAVKPLPKESETSRERRANVLFDDLVGQMGAYGIHVRYDENGSPVEVGVRYRSDGISRMTVCYFGSEDEKND